MNNKIFLARTLVAALFLIGCGDDDAGIIDSGPSDSGASDSGMSDAGDTNPDGSPDAGDADVPDVSPPNPGALLITTSDFSSAEMLTLDLETDGTSETMALSDQDTITAAVGARGALLERGMGNARLQTAGDPLITEHTINVDPADAMGSYASNPLTIVEISDTKAYVILGALSEIVVIDPSTGTETTRIDLSAYASSDDEDPNVDAVGAVHHDGRVYVGLGRFFFDDAFAIQFAAGSIIAVIDTNTDELIDADPETEGLQGIALTGNNPWRGMVVVDGELWVGSAGDGSTLDGGIERITLGDDLTSQGFALEEGTLAAELNGFALRDDGMVYVLAGEDVRVWDPASGDLAEAVATGVNGMTTANTDLFVWSGMTLRRFDATGNETSIAWTTGAYPIYSVVHVP